MIFLEKNTFRLLLIILIFVVTSCGSQNKTVQHDDSTGDINQVILYSQGWGSSYNYPITIDISTQISNENPSLITQIQNAVNTWNNAIGRNILSLRPGVITYTGNSFPGLYTPLQYPFKALYYDEMLGGIGGWLNNTGKNSSIIATTIYNSDGSSILGSDIRFNRDTYVFGDTTTGSNTSTAYIADMESIALHELGHVLGLGHAINETDSVMYPYINVGPNNSSFPTTVRCLTANDIARIRSIYPGGVPSNLNCIAP
jgi:Matrixin